MSELPYFKPYALSPLDHLLMPMHAHWFLSFHVEKPSSGATIISHGISSLVSKRPYLAGTITKPTNQAKNSKSNVLEIHPPTAAYLHQFPMLITRYHPNKTISLISSAEAVFNETFMPGDPRIPTPYPTFALRFQANVMEDGIILSVCFHHKFLDAYGLILVMESLARCCRYSNQAVDPPLICPVSDALSRAQITATVTSPTRDLGEIYGTSKWHYDPGVKAEESINRKYILRAETITFLKNACNALLPDFVTDIQSSKTCNVQSAQDILSGDDIVSALLWLCCTRARFELSSTSQKPSILLVPRSFSCTRPVETRRILHLTSLTNHIGNCIAVAKAFCCPTDMHNPTPPPTAVKTLKEPDPISKRNLLILTNLALRIHKARKSVDREHVQDVINNAVGCQDWDGFAVLPADVAITTLRRVDVYGLNFGSVVGRVSGLEVLENRLDGYCYILPGRWGDGVGLLDSA
ncbi:hypothetical protein BO78DRAFT_415528 [Aspergillus sclerotiicarbonarius CBS 121057]|uniref:Trichothecene 3-O-acetyltransferase-like N-terminal domain-containing protein n=1 Tax=Aspergillus sclerotiicarbonarius (strain CBS 121057 / IBT 28362) TaxID=1448318 RepID=A0A319F2L9_ASPSB|nr:hypothetical protein BO78DRAFT_415528 [Aspergillus sclerotiicarbonarius CBS 121057]